MRPFEYALLISWMFLGNINCLIVDVGEFRICYSDMNTIGGFPTFGSYNTLKTAFGHNCTHIAGNLILTDLYATENGESPDLTFLRSIQEITGYLIIMYSNVDVIPLSSLRVIRAENGGYRVRDHLPPAALIVRKNYKSNRALKHIDFGQLKSIVQGSVYIYENPGLCFWPSRVNWTELFESPGEQSVFGREAVVSTDTQGLSVTQGHVNLSETVTSAQCKSTIQCSVNCQNFTNGQAYCWGPGSTDCQQESACASLTCGRCYRDQDQDKQQSCCHPQCLGACWGPLATQCHACKKYNYSGACVTECPETDELTSSERVARYRLGHMCVAECPTGFLLENNACVTHCSGERTHAVGNRCVRCEDEQCPKTCEIAHPESNAGVPMKILDAVGLRSLVNCTYLKGNLVITNASFFKSTSVPDHEPITSMRQLWAMHSLREVSGYVYLDLGFLGPEVTNLSFLENLVKVGGFQSSVRASVMIMNTFAEFPGLRSLRQVSHGSVVFYNNSRLCYVRTLPWLITANVPQTAVSLDYAKVSGDLHVLVESGPSEEVCAKLGAECHEACDQPFGCWGPGPDQCVRCLHRRAGRHRCVMSCDGLSGFMSDRLSVPAPVDPDSGEGHDSHKSLGNGTIDTALGSVDADYTCLPCHPECLQTCSGPGAHQCIGDCKTAWSDGQCVSQCQPNEYLNVDRRICSTCSSACHPRQLTRQPVCTGPGTHPGQGGCNKCEMVLLQSSTVRAVNSLDNHHSTSTPHSCLRGSQCPSHYYLTTELVKPGTIYANVAETFTTVLPVCRPCHQLCSSCSSASVVRAGLHHLGCITCTAVWFRGACVEECPSKDTYTIVVRRIPVWNVSSTNTSATHSEWPNTTRVAHPHSDASQVFFTRQVSGHCLACDPMCHTGCWGPNPGQCKHCLHSRVHLSILPQSMLRFRPEWTEQLNEASSQQSSNAPIPTHAVQGRFVCVSQCPAELPFVVQDPTTGDHLCHHETVLSAKHAERIKEENALTFAMSGISLTSFDFMSTSDSTTGRTGSIFMWLMLISVATILCTLIICLWRAHQRKWKRYYWKRTFEPSSGDGFPGDSYTWSCIHATKYSLSACGANSAAHPGRRSETLEMGLLSKGKEAQNHGGTFANQAALDGTQTTRSSKAPNLGRLVMIQSDDLILDEQYGPLGTGAFGAVYRGVWRVVDPDAIGDQSAASTAIGTRSDSMHSSATLWTTAPTPSEDERSDRPLLVSPTCPSAANTPNFRQPPSYRMVHVAVKILNEVRGSSDLHALLDEAKVMASVSHQHCLPLLGVCLSQSRKCLVSAYVVNGSLERYVRIHALDLPPALLLDWAAQIADGMAYLQSRGIIHRDLATRNVLVTTREHLQITDFGLAKMLEGEDEENKGEVIVRSGRVPIRWLAIETLTHGRYSFKTDVWAYGVTIWEIFAFGQKPYDPIETPNVKSHILAGGRLPQPDICSLELYQIMLQCWNEDPQARPNFSELFNLFRELSRNPSLYVHSRTFSYIAMGDVDSSLGTDTRSHLTIYPGSQLSTDRPDSRPFTEHPANRRNSSSPAHANGSQAAQVKGIRASSPNRRFDPRRRLRCNSVVPPTQSSQTGRFAKYQQQKRRSVGGRAENGTLSTSLSITSSGLRSDCWSHSAFSHHSHPILTDVQEGGTKRNEINAMPPALTHPIKREHKQAGINTDSWASSGQPLLSSDPDSSLSQLMLVNTGYTSSDSRCSMLQPQNVSTVLSSSGAQPVIGAPLPTYTLSVGDAQGTSEHGPRESVTSSTLSAMPATFGLEEAAGYVWPQWPTAFSGMHQVSSNADASSTNPTDPSDTDGLLSLNRQLWLRRSERQRLFYLRQLQLYRSMIGIPLPEQSIEEAVEEATSRRHQWRNQTLADPLNESDAEDLSDDRYCPDPTSNTAAPHTSQT